MATLNIDALQEEVIEEFSAFDDWMDKYQMLIDLGNELPPLDAKYKVESNLIEGCQSRVWLQCDHTPAEIVQADLHFIDAIGLKDHLSPTRSNGLLSMVKQIKAYALGYAAKE